MQQKKPKLLLVIGNIYTKFLPSPIKVECFLVRDGLIIFCGTCENVKPLLQDIEPQLLDDLDGIITNHTNNQYAYINEDRMIMPGFVDSHCHPISGATQHSKCKLHGCKTWAEACVIIQEYLIANPCDNADQWIYIYGYSQSWFNTVEQTIQLLDQINNTNPLVLMRDDTHSYWVNSVTLNQCGITRHSEVPLNGVISMDSHGELNGSVAETAMNLIRKHFPPRGQAEHLKTLDQALKLLTRYGIVGFCDAAVKENMFQMYLTRYQTHDVKPWAYLCLCWNQLFLDQTQVEDIPMNFTHLDKLVRKYTDLVDTQSINPQEMMCKSVKLFLDGVLESKSALINEPYCKCQRKQDDVTQGQETNGLLMIKIPQLEEILQNLSDRSLQAHIHSIGDASTDIIVQTLTKLNLTNTSELRNYIAHLQFVSEQSLLRFKDLNLSGNFSPLWFYEYPSMSVLDHFVSPQMIESMYPIQQLVAQSIQIGFGSDWPVSSLNPLEGVEIATTRQPLGHLGPHAAIGNLEQRISLQQALHMYTLGSAWLLKNDHQSGSIEVGKRADFIILDQDLFGVEGSAIHRARVEATYIRGEMVYECT